MNTYKLYENKICQLLKKISTQENKKIITVANEFFKTYKKNGMIYLFGTGHSHMIAEEGHFRAGGFAPICPILHSSLAQKSKYKKKLSSVVDYHIDNCGPPGDALISIKKNHNVSPFSTIAGSFILNSIISEVAELCRNEKPFPFYISGNMPNAKKHNNNLLKKYISRNPHI